jgi:hypothetical protein
MYRLYHCLIPTAEMTSATTALTTVSTSFPTSPVIVPAMMLNRLSRSLISPLPFVEVPVGAGDSAVAEAISEDTDAKNEDIADIPGRVGATRVGNWRFSIAEPKFVTVAARAAMVELVSTLMTF